MGDIGDIIYSIAGEVDFLFAVGPFVYVKEKLSDLIWSIDDALGVDDNSKEDSDIKDIPEDPVVEYDDEAILKEANDFINDHMSEIKEVIVKVVQKISPSDYSSQQEYLKAAFDYAGDACWSYISDIFNDPEISPKLSEKITETMIKDTAAVMASAMFVEWGLKQKSDDKDAENDKAEDTTNNEKEAEVCE